MKFEFYSFWSGFDKKLFEEYFEKLFEGLDYDIVQIWTIFGSEPYILNTNPRILSVQWSGEACFKNTEKFNINLISSLPTKNIIPCLLAHCATYVHNKSDALTQKRILKPTRNKFCNFIVSNGCPVERKNVFLELSKHKFVDSCGTFLKNWTGPPAPPFGTSEYHEFLGSWKFMICFENCKQQYYMTEKLTNAYLGGCIPIYWGCPQVKEILNEKAILLLEDNTPEAINALIEKILELENNESLYEQMYNEPLFKNNVVPKEFDIVYLNNEIKNKLI